ncbi:hypothetical protein PENTCL1PPCAC_26063, partial [Pristionchus entomophagus]
CGFAPLPSARMQPASFPDERRGSLPRSERRHCAPAHVIEKKRLLCEMCSKVCSNAYTLKKHQDHCLQKAMRSRGFFNPSLGASTPLRQQKNSKRIGAPSNLPTAEQLIQHLKFSPV